MLNAVVQSNLTLDRSVLVPSITEMPYYLPHLRSTELTGFTHHSSAYELNVIQQPRDGHVPSSPHKRNGMQGQQKLSRSHADTDTARSAVKWPLDPPLVVEFKVNNNDTSKAYLTSPYWFCLVTIEAVNGEPVTPDTLFGTLTSSLHRVKMQDSRGKSYILLGSRAALTAPQTMVSSSMETSTSSSPVFSNSELLSLRCVSGKSQRYLG